MSERAMKCGDCGHPAPMTDGVLVLTDHADDCAGVQGKVLKVVWADE